MKTHGTKESVTFVPLLSLSPIPELETGGKGLKPVQTISKMNLITLPSESEIKNEMMDPGSLKSPLEKGRTAMTWIGGQPGPSTSFQTKDQSWCHRTLGPALVKQPPPTHLSLKMHFCYTLITEF